MIGLGSSSTLGIGLIIQLRDQFSQNADRISKSMTNMHANVNRAMANSFNSMTITGAGIATVGVRITRGMISATKSATEFQKVMLSIKALAGKDMTSNDLNNLSNLALRLGPKFGMSATEAARGMEDLVKAGLKASEIPKVLESLMLTSIGSGEMLGGEGGVAARMTDMLMAWGKTADQASRVGDILAKGAVESTVSFKDLSEAMVYSQNTLKGLNLTFEESVAMMSVMGNSGIKGSKAGIALQNMFKELTVAIGGGSRKKNAALAALGIDPKSLMDDFGSLRRPLEVIDRIKESIRGMGDIQKGNILFDIFGTRGGRGASPLIDFLTKNKNEKWLGKSLTEMVDTLTNRSAGENMRIFMEKSQGAAFQAERLKANWENFKIAVGNALLPLLNRTLPILSRIVESIGNFARNHPFIVKLVAIFGALLVPLGGILMLTGLIGRGMMALRRGFVGFRMAGLWAWNTLIARALVYLGIMRGIGANQKMNAAGSIIDAATGRIVTPAYKVGAGKLFGGPASLFGRFSSSLGSLTGGFSRLLPILGGLARIFSVVGLVSMALSAFGISFKTQLQVIWGSIKWVLASAVNLIMGIIETLTFGLVDFGGGGWSARQDKIAERTFEGVDPIERAYQPRERSSYGNNRYTLPEYAKGDTVVHIHVPGEKTISKRINDRTENEMVSKYGLNTG